MEENEPQREEVVAQYDRFIMQTREEIGHLYWLYNFFFLVNSAIAGGIFVKQIDAEFLFIAKVIGLLLSFYWFWITYKQKRWRDSWLDKIADIEKNLGYPTYLRMWPNDSSSFLFDKNGLWKALLWLPKGFAALWFLLIIGVALQFFCSAGWNSVDGANLRMFIVK